MISSSPNIFRVLPKYQTLMRIVGLDAEAVFAHPQIIAWRTLPDRDNCTLDAELDGKPIRLHVKRYQPARGSKSPAQEEVDGLKALQAAEIATIPLVGWGTLDDRRSFVITEHLAGYRAADKSLEAGMSFDALIEPTANLAARLHSSGLHHRDLYLCHFFVKEDDANDIRLIDTARVRRFGFAFTRRRWIVKDLSQFCYSLRASGIDDVWRDRWLDRYAAMRKLDMTRAFRRSILRKVKSIARHDAKLRKSQPTRNISIPEGA